MCGLVGAAGDLTPLHEKVFKNLLVLDVFRGEDSTGVCAVSKFMGNVSVVKELGNPFNLFETNRFNKAMNVPNKVLMGHNRYATSGGVSRAGAHPFEFDTLVGAHNGTLQGRYRLDDDREFKVDSESLYHNIEKNGLRETIRRLGGHGNAWSLTWWDKVENTLNFLRNEDRPMFMCFTEDSKALFWASEYWMLEVALNRNGVKHGGILSTLVNNHIAFPIDNKGVMDKPRMVEVKPDPVVYLPPANGPWNNNRFPNQQKTTGSSGSSTPAEANVVELRPSADKKQGEDKKPGNGLATDAFYVGAAKRVLEILCEKRDGNGMRYLSMMDMNEPNIDIRLYPSKQDLILFSYEGSDIMGAINSLEFTDKTALRPYYKVNPWTVEYTLEPDAPEGDDTLMDHKGNLVTYKEWEKKYPTCAWCSSNLYATDPNRYTTGGDCLCPDCVSNPQATELVTLI